MRMRIWVLAVVPACALTLAACAGGPARVLPAPAPSTPPAKETPGKVVTPSTVLTGRVLTANPGARFVILSFPIGRMPALEQRLNVYRQGLKVGELRVSGPQVEENIVADIFAGEAQAGDQVRDR